MITLALFTEMEISPWCLIYWMLWYHMNRTCRLVVFALHDDVIKWKHFPRYWPFMRGIHRSPVNSPRKGQWRGALMFSLICAWINGWVNNREVGNLRHHRAHYDVIVIHIDYVLCIRCFHHTIAFTIIIYSLERNHSSTPQLWSNRSSR